MSSIRIYNVERRRGPSGLEGPDTPPVNLRRAKSCYFFALVLNFAEAKRRPAGRPTNQNDVGLSTTSHQSFGHFFSPLANVEPVDAAVAPPGCPTGILKHWGQISLGSNLSCWMVALKSPPPLSGTILAVVKHCFSSSFSIQPSLGRPDLRFSSTPPSLPQHQRKSHKLYLHIGLALGVYSRNMTQSAAAAALWSREELVKLLL